MSIPAAQARLRELAGIHGIPELNTIADGLHRRPPSRRRAPPSSVPMTAALAIDIRAYAATRPSLSQAAIARVFKVNPGRVSEALAGEW